jgi:cytochrome P450
VETPEAAQPPAEAAGRCPVRKLGRPEDARTPLVERVAGPHGEHWVIRSPHAARRLLRDEARLRQAGFGAETGAAGPPDDGDDRPRRGLRRRLRPSILYLEGPDHRTRRRAAARFFAPKVVESYRQVVEDCADSLVAPLRAGGSVDVATASMLMAVQVAGRVVGLTNSSVPGMSRRLGAFFEGDLSSGAGGVQDRLRQLRTSAALLRFYWLDVKPAIRARRRDPGADVVSQLLQDGFSDPEVLVECVTYAAAGMVTTREFITLAAWHLLDDAALLAHYRACDVEGRQALLEELLRLEPVVGQLQRRTTAPVTVEHEGAEVELPVGTRVVLDLRAANADEALAGGDAECVRPGRTLAERGWARSVLSFGDGHHRCPGGPIALMESEVLLTRLLAEDLVADGPPQVGWGAVTQGYELRGFVVRRAAQG